METKKKLHKAVETVKYFLSVTFHLTFVVFLAQADNLKSYFPNEFDNFYYPVLQYLEKKEITNTPEIRNELIYILDFLKDAILAHETNIDNQISKNTLICLSPKLVDGELVISEVEKKIYSFNNTIKEYVFIPNFNIFSELVHFLKSAFTYNAIIDFWYTKTNELLGEKIDYDQKTTTVISKVINEWTKY